MAHQFSYTIPFSGSPGASGLGDVLLNYRYQLMSENARLPAVAPRLSLIIPTGRESDRLGTGASAWQFNLPASKQFGDLYVHANVGATRLQGEWVSLLG